VTVERGGGLKDLTVALPVRWWWTDTRYRQSSVEPRSYFEDRALSAEEKTKLGLPAEGFASAVKYVSSMAQSVQAHELRVGDIIVAVDGKDRDENADTASLFIVLHKKPGETGKLEVLRDGKKITMPLKTIRMSFRK
jgi:S1-C subfamily serine protease